MRVGHFLSREEFGPRELVRQAQMAEQAGLVRQIGAEQERFFEIYADEVLPRLQHRDG